MVEVEPELVIEVVAGLVIEGVAGLEGAGDEVVSVSPCDLVLDVLEFPAAIFEKRIIAGAVGVLILLVRGVRRIRLFGMLLAPIRRLFLWINILIFFARYCFGSRLHSLLG
jgi:hypothetical protein